MARAIFALLSAFLVVGVKSATINNRVSADPVIECSSDTIIANFATQGPFEGHVYVKGHYGKTGCRADATLSTAASLAVPFNSCGVRRQRSSNPAGLYISTTVVISFHPMFITMVDKAYNIRCFYMETDKTVNANLDVSHLTTAVITQSIPMPACKYEVLQDDGPNAPVVKFATVGQQVYHRWSCESALNSGAEGIFCMTVHSCYVNDNEGREVQLLDESGCALDRFVLNNLRYSGDMEGGQSTMVFKFADQNSLFFQCQIRLSLKEGGFCKRTADECPEPSRGKRSAGLVASSSGEREPVAVGENVDVFSDSITVFDIDEPINDRLDAAEIAALNRRTQARRGRQGPHLAVVSEAGLDVGQMCLSPVTFGILVSVLGVVLLASVISLAALCLRRDAANVDPTKRLQAIGAF